MTAEPEILAPTDETSVDDPQTLNTDAALTGATGRLMTAGQVKSEMGKVYRRARTGKITWEDARSAIWVLRGILSAIEVEQKFALPDDPDEDRPALTGLVLIGPANPTSKEGS